MAKWFTYLARERVSSEQEGVNPAWWLHHRSLARTNKVNPYLLANEWISANIGWFLRLPIPPFALMRAAANSRRHFASLDYGGKESRPDDLDAKAFVRCLPREATGVVVFDILIANTDRHERNLQVDVPDKPSLYELIDHEEAVFGRRNGRGLERVNGLLATNRLEVGCNRVLPVLNTADFVPDWCDFVHSIPDRFIKEVCAQATDTGISTTEQEAACQLLCDRKRRIHQIIDENRTAFRSIAHWPWLPQ